MRNLCYSVTTCLALSTFFVSDLLEEEDQDLHPAQEGQGIGVLAPENGIGDLGPVLRTGMKERKTESAGRKVFPA